MKFEVQVIQNGNVKSDDGEFEVACSAVVAIFQVIADNVSGALQKVVGSKEFKNIDRVVDLTIEVVNGKPTYYFKI